MQREREPDDDPGKNYLLTAFDRKVIILALIGLIIQDVRYAVMVERAIGHLEAQDIFETLALDMLDFVKRGQPQKQSPPTEGEMRDEFAQAELERLLFPGIKTHH